MKKSKINLFVLLFFTLIFAGSADDNGNVFVAKDYNKLKLILTSPDYKAVPGDRFLLEYSDRIEYLFIDQNYYITSKVFGKVKVEDFTINKIYEIINDKMQIYLGKNIIFKFEMLDFGIFQVLVKGEVKNSLMITSSGIDRLDYIFSKTPITEYTSQRKIKLFRDGKSEYFDLFHFQKYGDINKNPLLRPGDIIEFEQKDKSVEIKGEVKSPGKYELLKNENLKMLLSFANGLTLYAYPELTNIMRVSGGSKENSSFYIDIIKENDYILNNLDEITINNNINLQPVVFIRGAVNNLKKDHKSEVQLTDLREAEKKEVDIILRIENGTKIFDVLNRLEGFKDSADLKNGYIIRIKENVSVFTVNLFDLYYKNDMSKNIELYNLDQIVIPSKNIDIGVYGMVKNPGLIKYENNKNALYYILESGGVIPINGNNTAFWLIRKNSATPQIYTMNKATDIIIQEGDRIEIKPSGMHASTYILPIINSFLGLSINAASLAVSINTLYYNSINQK